MTLCREHGGIGARRGVEKPVADEAHRPPDVGTDTGRAQCDVDLLHGALRVVNTVDWQQQHADLVRAQQAHTVGGAKHIFERTGEAIEIGRIVQADGHERGHQSMFVAASILGA